MDLFIIVRWHPCLNGIHPVKTCSRAMNSGGIAIMNILFLVLPKSPAVQFIIKFSAHTSITLARLHYGAMLGKALRITIAVGRDAMPFSSRLTKEGLACLFQA